MNVDSFMVEDDLVIMRERSEVLFDGGRDMLEHLPARCSPLLNLLYAGVEEE